MAKEILCGFGVHVDAVAGWLGSYGGEDSPTTFRGACSLAKLAAHGCCSYSSASELRRAGPTFINS